MARVTIHKCDRCGAESRDRNNLTEIAMPSGGFARELCPPCVERLDKFLQIDATTGNRFVDAAILTAAADVLKAQKPELTLDGLNMFVLEGQLRTAAAMLEDDE